MKCEKCNDTQKITIASKKFIIKKKCNCYFEQIKLTKLLVSFEQLLKYGTELDFMRFNDSTKVQAPDREQWISTGKRRGV